MAEPNASPPKLTRRCLKCKTSKTIHDFQTPRSRLCISCHLALRHNAVVFDEHTRKFTPAPRVPGLTMTPEGMAKYQRERHRNRRANEPNLRLPLVLPKNKLCRRCQRLKPLSEFESWRVRICLACDGPPLKL